MDRGPFAHLVLVESEAALGVLEGRLDRPAKSGDADQQRQSGSAARLGQVGQVVGVLVLTAVPADQQVPFACGSGRVEGEIAPGRRPAVRASRPRRTGPTGSGSGSARPDARRVSLRSPDLAIMFPCVTPRIMVRQPRSNTSNPLRPKQSDATSGRHPQSHNELPPPH